VAAQLSEEFHCNAIGCQCNVANKDDVDSTVKTVLEKYGKIDVLINNAGITRDSLLARMQESDWDQVLDINLKGAYHCMKACCRPMMKARYGRIINISSVVALSGNPGQANYAAAKAGLIGLSKSVAKELASRNITVNIIMPGYIDTDMTQALPEAARESILDLIPLKRPGNPADIANAVAFLAAEDTAYITGQILSVDGGMTM
ncbi:MAG: 3-oxoacyl-ACP reductase family protein, partial [Lentisphaeria bacterium]